MSQQNVTNEQTQQSEAVSTKPSIWIWVSSLVLAVSFITYHSMTIKKPTSILKFKVDKLDFAFEIKGKSEIQLEEEIRDLCSRDS